MTPGRAARAALAIVVIVALVVAGSRLDLSGAGSHWAALRGGWIVAALAAFACILPAWAAQWSALAPGGPRPRFSAMFPVVAVTSSAMNTSLLFIGEAVALASLTARARVPLDAAVAVLALDHLVTGLLKVAIVGTALLVVPQTRGLLGGAGVLLLAVIVATGAVVALAHATPRIARGGGAWWIRLRDALAPVRSLPQVAAALGFGALKVALELVAIFCIQRAFGVNLPVASVVVVCAAVGLGTALPLVPANLGTYEATVVVAYGTLGVEPGMALAMAIAQHACQLAATALPGYRWLLTDLSIARASR